MLLHAPGHPGRVRLLAGAGAVAIGVLLATLVAFDDTQRMVALPMYLALAVPIALVAVLWQRDGAAPYFDIGAICVLATFVYVFYPLMAFLVSGMGWTELSDFRLLNYQTTPAEFAKVAWWGDVYLVALAIAYAVFRRRAAVNYLEALEQPGRTATVAMVIFFVGIFTFLQAVQLVFDVDLNPTYGAGARTIVELPLWLHQVSAKAAGIATVFQFALVLLCVSRYDEPFFRWILWIWLGVQTASVIVIFGARTPVVVFVLSWLLAHNRLRRPLRPAVVLGMLVGLVILANLYGVLRMTTDAGLGDSLSSGNTEFQALYGTAFDLMLMRDTGRLPAVPWQLYVADFLRLIPQQILPFEKLDPAQWYLDLIGLRGEGAGFMFGVIGEGVIGLGVVEMALRGVFVGVVFAHIHNWYARNARRFWPTVFYVWLAVYSYLTYRASTLYLVSTFVFMFLPAYLVVRAFELSSGSGMDRLRGTSSKSPRC